MLVNREAHINRTGDVYERQAIIHLLDRGLEILERNFTCKVGEIDVVCRNQSELIFVEVRYRSNPDYASAVESVTLSKQRKLIRAAQVYLQQHPELAQLACRFDVIAITPGGDKDHVQWLPHAFY